MLPKYGARVTTTATPAAGGRRKSGSASRLSVVGHGSKGERVPVALVEEPALGASAEEKSSEASEPERLLSQLHELGFLADPFLASQLALFRSAPSDGIRSLLLEGPPGVGKSFLASCFASLTDSALVHFQSTAESSGEELQELLADAFLRSRKEKVCLLIEDIDAGGRELEGALLRPLQEGVSVRSHEEPIVAVRENLMVILTKGEHRNLSDALLRRLHIIELCHLSEELEHQALATGDGSPFMKNLLAVAGVLRAADDAYPIERPPSSEELRRTATHLSQLLEWGGKDPSFIGQSVFLLLVKSERDREEFLNLLRYHPFFASADGRESRNTSDHELFGRLGNVLLRGLPGFFSSGGEAHYEAVQGSWNQLGAPHELTQKLAHVGYECLPFNAQQISLLLGTPTEKVRSLLLEGPSGCGKSFMAKCLAKIVGAEMFCLSCYPGMDSGALAERPSQIGLLEAQAGSRKVTRENLVELSVIAKAFLKSQTQPVLLLVDELDKAGPEIDTFFLGPLQDGTIWCQSRSPIDADLENLLVIFTKNDNRVLDQALLRRLHPVRMTYLDSTLETNILSRHCNPKLVANLVSVADRMRQSDGSYEFERPPAPEELLTAGRYLSKLLEWGEVEFAEAGRNIWAIISKSEHDRAVLDHMLRFHPDFEDPLTPDSRNAPQHEIHARLGRWVLKGLVDDPLDELREDAWLQTASEYS
ncbi:AAA family ATPase [bacterium]|nr:AAA family ATPase [bacterium]